MTAAAFPVHDVARSYHTGMRYETPLVDGELYSTVSTPLFTIDTQPPTSTNHVDQPARIERRLFSASLPLIALKKPQKIESTTPPLPAPSKHHGPSVPPCRVRRPSTRSWIPTPEGLECAFGQRQALAQRRLEISLL